MSATVWKGQLTFGLVSIPIRLVRAARAQRVSLRQLYRRSRLEEPKATSAMGARTAAFVPGQASTAEPIQETREAPEDRKLIWNPSGGVAPVRRVYEAPGAASEHDQPLRAEDLVKGYEYAKGEYVVLDEQELRGIVPKTSPDLQIAEFVPFDQIDPVYLETSYYVAPDETSEKAYALLFKAMQETGQAAIGQLTMHRRDHVVILRPGKTGMLAHTMFYADEVRTVDEFRTNTGLVSEKELDLAKTLISALATSFEPEKFKNEFRERLNELIESRAAHREVARAEPTSTAKVIDIMDALRQSLAAIEQTELASKPTPAKMPRKLPAAERSKKVRARPSGSR